MLFQVLLIAPESSDSPLKLLYLNGLGYDMDYRSEIMNDKVQH